MESPIKKYKELLNIDNIKGIAYNTLFVKYIEKNLKGDNKKWEIDSTDQEGLMMKKNGGFPIPGFIYTFIYPPKNNDHIKIITDGKEKEYIDFVPLVFCTGIDKLSMNFKGINLNTIPNLERVKFLETYYKGYNNFFKNIEETTQNNKLALNMSFISAMTSKEGVDLIKAFSKEANANFGYGYRTYSMKRIKQLRMVEYTEWDYIPHYDPKNAFKLMNQKMIHGLYWRTK